MSINNSPPISEFPNDTPAEQVPAQPEMVSSPTAEGTAPALPTKRLSLEWCWRHTRYSIGQEWGPLSSQNLLQAISLAVRDLMMDTMFETERRYREADAKRVYYLSMEFLVGISTAQQLVA